MKKLFQRVKNWFEELPKIDTNIDNGRLQFHAWFNEYSNTMYDNRVTISDIYNYYKLRKRPLTNKLFMLHNYQLTNGHGIPFEGFDSRIHQLYLTPIYIYEKNGNKNGKQFIFYSNKLDFNPKAKENYSKKKIDEYFKKNMGIYCGKNSNMTSIILGEDVRDNYNTICDRFRILDE